MTMTAAVYFMANQYNTVLYVAVTSNLPRRVLDHKVGSPGSFTDRYNCRKLVYYETGTDIHGAIQREKQLKNWRRAWKNALIEKMNPTWRDLAGDIGVTAAAEQDSWTASRRLRLSPQ
jgi:putative endonuclease